jgi:hypothetical protein
MRLLAVAVILAMVLAGCTTPDGTDPADDRPADAIFNGTIAPVGDSETNRTPAEFVPMDPVAGETSAEGSEQANCGAVGGGTYISVRKSPFFFVLPSNATAFTFAATWTANNPTTESLYFEAVYNEEVLAAAEGEPGMTATMDASFVDDFSRQVSIEISLPPCQGSGNSAVHYDGIVARLELTFA